MLLVRALFSFLALPVMVAGLVPAWMTDFAPPERRFAAIGFTVLGVGVALLLWCVRDFFVSGRGTLAPWDPPRHLVVVGLYRFVRNPMYLAVLTIVVGWDLLYLSWSLAMYALGLVACFHLRVVRYEEPTLKRQFNDEWDAYAATTPRWIPRFRREKR